MSVKFGINIFHILTILFEENIKALQLFMEIMFCWKKYKEKSF